MKTVYGDLVCALNRIIGYLNILTRLLICLQFKFPTKIANQFIDSRRKTDKLSKNTQFNRFDKMRREKRKQQQQQIPLRLFALDAAGAIWERVCVSVWILLSNSLVSTILCDNN